MKKKKQNLAVAKILDAIIEENDSKEVRILYFENEICIEPNMEKLSSTLINKVSDLLVDNDWSISKTDMDELSINFAISDTNDAVSDTTEAK